MARWHDVLLEIDDELQAIARSEARILQTLDPTTLLLTACVERLPDGFEMPSWVPERVMMLEFEGVGPFTLSELAGAPIPAAAMSSSPDGWNSVRRRDILEPLGCADDLRVVFVDGRFVWGAALLYRMGEQYTPVEVAAVAARAPEWGRRLRLGILEDAVVDPGMTAGPPGIARVVNNNIVEPSPAADRFLRTLSAAQRLAVATTLVGESARSVTVIGSNGPVTIHRTDRADDAVIIERANPTATGEVLMAAYDLTPRERDVVTLLARGLNVALISRRLDITEWTVKDHTKSIHRKVGVNSRGELVARLFAQHFAPRLAKGDLPGPHGYFTSR